MKFKKLITCMLIFVMIFNFLTNTISCIATDVEEGKEVKEEEEFIQGATNVLLKGLDGLVGIFTWVFRAKWFLISYAVQGLTSLVGYSEGVIDGWEFETITPAHILFNKINLTDINIFEMNPPRGKAIKTIRSNIRKWYYAMFTLAAIILLCILVYIGIRMALSTVAEKKAVYKNWLMNWFASFILLFMLHFIIRGTIYLNGQLVKIFEKAEVSEMSDSILGFVTVTGTLAEKTMLGVATVGFAALGVYICLVILTIIFLIMYIKRMLTISFLIIIAPLITITYSIDKLGDNKSQALDTWLKEFMYGVLIQPFHCIIYLVFVSQAIGLCNTGTLASMLLAVMMMFFIMKAEGIIRKIFGFEKASSAATGAMAGAALMTGLNGIKKMVGDSKKMGAAVTKLKDRTGGDSGGTGGNGNQSRPQRTNGTREKDIPNVRKNDGDSKEKKDSKVIKGAKSFVGKVFKANNSNKIAGAGIGLLIDKMSGGSGLAGFQAGRDIGSVADTKAQNLKDRIKAKRSLKNAYCNYQTSSGLSDAEMTAYTDELLNDPETLEDMQRIEGESDEQWKARTQRSDEIGDDNFKKWKDRMVYAKCLYASQYSYRKSGIDGDDANDKIADTIRKLQFKNNSNDNGNPTP